MQRYHDRVAGRYDDSYTDAFWQWHDALTWDYLKPHLPRDANASVIDLGCGTGKWIAKIARSGYRVVGVDISGKMIERARKKVGESAGGAEASFLQADLMDLSPLPAAAFALATAMGDPIGCTASPAATLKQIRRILTENGVLVATFDNRHSALDFYLQQGDPDQMARFLRDGRTHWLTRDVDERFPIHTYSPDGVRRLLEEGGFEVIEMIGKTVLPMRHYRHLLEAPAAARRWARIEKSLARSADAIGRASHIQVSARRRRVG